MNFLSKIEAAPSDPILGITEAFNNDQRTEKVNLSAGVYYDEHGKLPLMHCVLQAKKIVDTSTSSYGYLPIDGLKSYQDAVQELLFGAVQDNIVTVQTIAGTGALRIGADFLYTFNQNKTIAISNPSWENHRQIFTAVGLNVEIYSYYDARIHDVDLSGLLSDLNKLPNGSTVLLHACCHNPTGIDLDEAAWKEVAKTLIDNEHIAFLDIAYQGFANNIEQDIAAIKILIDANVPCMIASSFSKNLSLYGERIGSLSIVCKDKYEAEKVRSQIKRIIRTNYSSPHGFAARIATEILINKKLKTLWHEELSSMRTRIKLMRHALYAKLKQSGFDFEFITQQNGLFSYSGLTEIQIERLKSEYAIYAVKSGRICVSGINNSNVDYVANAIAKVLN